MSTTIAAFVATLFATGMASAVNHQMALVGGAVGCVLFALYGMLSRGATMYVIFLVSASVLSIIALVSSEANTAEFTSTIHILSSYLALISLAFASRDLSSFCQQTMLMTNMLLTGWILYQAQQLDSLEAWSISNPSGATNLMPAQINMTLGLVLSRIYESQGLRKLLYSMLLGLNLVAVFTMMSRNGIGAMLIILILYVLFNQKKLAAFLIIAMVAGTAMFDQLLNTPFVYNLLVRMRIVGFVPRAPRSVIWQISFDNIWHSPWLGVGPGEPRKILAVLDINHAHNNIVQVAFETGIPSAVIITLITGLLLWMPISMVFRQRESFAHTLAIIAYVVFSWTGGPLHFPGTTLLLACCVNEARMAIARQNTTDKVICSPVSGSLPSTQRRAA
ncbi:MAG: O-antigen ligase family protein [Planctomycetaceae bacterium]